MPSLRSDILTLVSSKVAGVAIPVLAIPFLARRLGVDAFGQLVTAQAIFIVITLVVSFGFTISANRLFALSRNDNAALRSVFRSTLSAQFLLWVLTVIAQVSCLLFVQPSFNSMIGMLMVSALISLGSVFFPVWAFQGLGLLKEATIVELASRLICFLAMFALVRGPSDVIIGFTLQVAWVVPAALYAVIRLSRLGVVDWRPVLSLRKLMPTYRSSVAPFLAMSFTAVYTTLNSVLLASFHGPATAGFYNGAERGISGVRLPIAPLRQAFYPRLVIAYRDDRRRFEHLAKRLLVLLLTGYAVACLFLLVTGRLLMRFYLGPEYSASGDVIVVLALSLPLIAVSVWADTLLLASGAAYLSTTAIGIGAACHLLYGPYLMWANGTSGAAWSVVLTELIIASILCTLLRRNWHRASVAPTTGVREIRTSQ